MNSKSLFIVLSILLSLILVHSCAHEKTQDDSIKTDLLNYTPIDGDAELKRINQELVKNPNDVELLALKADILFKLYRQDDGLNDIAKAFRIDSTNLEVRRVHAGYMMGQLKVLAARDDYNYIIERDPGNAEAYLGMARTYAVEGNHVKAFQFTDEALKRNLKFRDAYVLKGLMFRTEGKLDLAISSYQTAVEIDPNYYSGYVALGNLYELKNNPIALDFYKTALQVDSNGLDALYGVAMISQNNKEFEDAKTIYRKIITISPEYYTALFNQGYIKLVYESSYDSAAYFFKKTLEIEPLYTDAWYNLGLSEQARGKNKEAIKSFKEALKIDPSFKKAEIEINNILRMK